MQLQEQGARCAILAKLLQACVYWINTPVSCGGGTSHRLGLHDAALYKDNHLAWIEDFAVGLHTAIESVRKTIELQFVEIEVDSVRTTSESSTVANWLLFF